MPQGEAATEDRSAKRHKWPLVTVNILAYNRRDDLRRTLRAVTSELDYPPDRLEVIVVDNASEDDTAQMVAREFPAVNVISRDENIGVSGWNDGFRAGRGDYFLVLDDDCYVTGDALKLAVSAARDEAADLVSFRIASPWHQGFAFNERWRTGLLAFWGCSALISARAIRQLGGFDPLIFVWGHETEFTARVLDAGFRHLYLPEVESLHLKRIQPMAQREWVAHLGNVAYFAGKRLQPQDALGAIANLIVRSIIGSIKRPAAAREHVGGVLDGVRLGIRHRAPMRTEVSRAYRHNYLDFVGIHKLLRGLGERLRPPTAPPGGPETGPVNPARVDRFYARRPHVYPAGRGSLRL